MIIFSRLIDKHIAEYQNDLIEKHCEEVENMYRQMRGVKHDLRASYSDHESACSNEPV